MIKFIAQKILCRMENIMKIKSRYTNKVITISIILSICLIISAVLVFNSINTKERVLMNTSNTYNYADVNDLTDNSDCIAIVKIKDNGTKIGNGIIPETLYLAEVLKPVYNCEKGDELTIYMTGGEKDNRIFEVASDPLMKSGQKFMIFAQKNDDGTYTALSGSQGRMQYDDGKISSLNIVNKQVKEHSFSSIKLEGVPEDSFIDTVKKRISNQKR